MENKLKLYGFNNLTKTLSFNIYDVCYAKSEREQKDYIAYIDEQYNSERLTNILCEVTRMIGATVLNISKQDYDPQGASVTLLISDKHLQPDGIDSSCNCGNLDIYSKKQSVAAHLDKSHVTVHTLGIYGVAVSTLVSRFLAVGFLYYLMVKRTSVKIVPKFFFIIKKKVLKQIFSVGLPGAGENLTWQLQFLFMTSIVGTFGTVALATQGIYAQMCGLIMLFSISVGMGTEILVSHYAGAMQFSLANRQLLHSVKMGMLITALLSVNIPFWLGDTVLSIFTDDPRVFEMARPIFYVSVVMEVGRILNIIIINSLRAVGDTRFPVIMAVISMWGVSVTIGTFLSVYMHMGLLGVWIGFCCDECSRGVIMLIRWKTKGWIKAAKRNYRINYMKKKVQKPALKA